MTLITVVINDSRVIKRFKMTNAMDWKMFNMNDLDNIVKDKVRKYNIQSTLL